MNRAWIPAVVVGLFVLVVVAVSANVIGHGQQGQDTQQQGNEPEHTSYRPPEPPDREDPLDRLIWDARVLAPHRYGGLTLYPIELGDQRSDFRPLTFDEAIDRGDLAVREIGEGRVNEVQVRNRGRQPVFMLSGEIMSGSKQDRIASADVLVPPRSDWIVLDVYCVEHGRWEKLSDEFGSKRSLANAAIRQAAQGAAPQTDVWENVAEQARAVGVDQSERGAFNEIYDAKAVQERLAPYRGKLGPILTARTAGVAAVAHGRVIAVDLFANPALLRELWDKLLDSYSLDAMEDYEEEEPPRLDEQDVEQFLWRAASDRADRYEHRTPGVGSMFSIESDRVDGFMLSYRRDVVHANLFEPRYRILEPKPLRQLPE